MAVSVANLCLHKTLLYMFTAVAVAIAAPTAAQYICCMSNGLGTPSPIIMPPMSIPDILILVNLIAIRFDNLQINHTPFTIESVGPRRIRYHLLSTRRDVVHVGSTRR